MFTTIANTPASIKLAPIAYLTIRDTVEWMEAAPSCITHEVTGDSFGERMDDFVRTELLSGMNDVTRKAIRGCDEADVNIMRVYTNQRGQLCMDLYIESDIDDCFDAEVVLESE